MRAGSVCLLLSVVLLLFPVVLLGKADYAKLDPDSPKVEQTSELAVRELGSDRRAVDVETRVVDLIVTSTDIIGIPTGLEETGVGVSGRVAEVDQALKDLGAKVTETEVKMELPGDILFDFDKSDIRPDAQEALGKVAVVIRGYPGKAVLIEGHTDSKGSDAYNRELSMQRAGSVKDWLQEKENLSDTPFETKGSGESKPRATNETDEGRQRNRRVEITIKR